MSHSKPLHKMLVDAEEECVFYYYSDGHLGRLLKWASNSFLKNFVVVAVTMSVDR